MTHIWSHISWAVAIFFAIKGIFKLRDWSEDDNTKSGYLNDDPDIYIGF